MVVIKSSNHQVRLANLHNYAHYMELKDMIPELRSPQKVRKKIEIKKFEQFYINK